MGLGWSVLALSLKVAVCATALNMVASVAVNYALVHLRFPGAPVRTRDCPAWLQPPTSHALIDALMAG